MEFTNLSKALICASLLGLSACQTTNAVEPEVIQAALEATQRTEVHRARDEGRKPAEVLRFSGVKPGDTVVEIAPASGYYTALLSRIVGPEGRVIGIGPERIFEVFANARNGFQEFMNADPLANVSYTTANLDAVELPENVDQIWMVLYYHDTYWTGEDRAEMNRRFFEALKPGGIYMFLDHNGVTDPEQDITQTLHRMDVSKAKEEIEAAGFILAEHTDILRNPGDPLNISVFNQEWRGKTDRVVWKFVKPK